MRACNNRTPLTAASLAMSLTTTLATSLATTLAMALTTILWTGVCAAADSAPAQDAPAGKAAKGKSLLRTQQDGEIVGWKSFSEDPKTKTADVWTLTPDRVLVCKGKPLGYLYTEKAYANFVLSFEWRSPPGKKPGSGGVLVRMTGKHRVWPKSLEAQLNAGAEGDFWGLDGFQFDGPAEKLKKLEHPQFGKLTNLPRGNVELKPAGEWNRYEIIADGPTVTLKINGRQVNQATHCDTEAGPILFTSEGDEIHFRNIRLRAKP